MIELRPYQKPSAEALARALVTFHTALDASDTGTGKTPKAVTVAKHIDMPIGIICPLAVVPTWKRWCAEAEVAPYFIENYEKLRTGNTIYGSWFKYKGAARLVGGRWIREEEDRFTWELQPPHLLIFDEVHYCKSPTSQNGELLSAAARSGHATLMLSATAAESPLDLKHIGFALGLHSGTDQDFYQFAVNHGAQRRAGGRNFVFYGNKNGLARLHKKIFPEKGHRIRIADLGDAFPRNEIIAEAYDIGDVQGIYDELEAALDELAQKTEGEENELTLRLRARQQIELLRVPVMIEKAIDAIAQGRSAVLFANFRETIAQLSEQLMCPFIHGDVPKGTREETIRNFQENNSHILVCQTQTGGVGISLHDVNGRPRTSIISPTDSAIQFKQMLGRIHRDGSLSPALQYVIYGANSIEEEVCRNLRRKLKNIDQINDSDLI